MSTRRASSRQRFRPLDFWANERVVYKASQAGPVLAGVIMHDGLQSLSPPQHSPKASPSKREKIRQPPQVRASRETTGSPSPRVMRDRKRGQDREHSSNENRVGLGHVLSPIKNSPAEVKEGRGGESNHVCSSPASESKVLSCRRWGRHWQYHVRWANTGESRWETATDVPANLIEAFLHEHASGSDAAPSRLTLPPRKRKLNDLASNKGE